MRPRSGPADLRKYRLNRDEDLRNQMRPRSQSVVDLRELMKLKRQRTAEPNTVSEELISQLEATVNKKVKELESDLRNRERAIKRLKPVSRKIRQRAKKVMTAMQSPTTSPRKKGKLNPQKTS